MLSRERYRFTRPSHKSLRYVSPEGTLPLLSAPTLWTLFQRFAPIPRAEATEKTGPTPLQPAFFEETASLPDEWSGPEAAPHHREEVADSLRPRLRWPRFSQVASQAASRASRRRASSSCRLVWPATLARPSPKAPEYGKYLFRHRSCWARDKCKCRSEAVRSCPKAEGVGYQDLLIRNFR